MRFTLQTLIIILYISFDKVGDAQFDKFYHENNFDRFIDIFTMHRIVFATLNQINKNIRSKRNLMWKLYKNTILTKYGAQILIIFSNNFGLS